MQREPASTSAPLRKVKASRRGRNPAKAESDESNPEAAVQTFVPVERPRSMTPRQRHERMRHLDTVPQEQRESEQVSTLRSTNRRRRADGTAVSESLGSAAKTFQRPSSDEESTSTVASGTMRQRRTRVRKTGGAAQTQKKRSERSPTAGTSAKPAASGTKGKAKQRAAVPQEQDDDEWTVAELMMLYE